MRLIMPEVKQPELHLNDFDGLLEVLLHLIQESKMDIYDIQISRITEQYMQYIYDAQQLNLEIVGEYFVMAAKLMVIKSKMLLPTITDDQPDEQQADPREELVSQLLNYKRYKLVAASMKKREMKRRESFTRSELSVAPHQGRTDSAISVQQRRHHGQLRGCFETLASIINPCRR